LLFPTQGIKMTMRSGEMLCTEVVPRIRASIPATTRMFSAEDHSELIADTIAYAAAMLHSAEAAAKKVTGSTVAYFAVKLTRSGRRSTSSSKTDVMHPGSQLSGRTRVVSFDEPYRGPADTKDCATQIKLCLLIAHDSNCLLEDKALSLQDQGESFLAMP
jgi:hypothetical protein